MALLTSATATNRIVDQALAVTYTKAKVFGSYSYLDTVSSTTTLAFVWEYVRRASMTYRYIGMTKAAAEAAAASIRTSLTRSDIKVSVWDGSYDSSGGDHFSDEDAGSILMAAVAVVLDEGEAYSVIVQIDETDSRMRQFGLAAPSSLFTAENSRTYIFTYTGS